MFRVGWNATKSVIFLETVMRFIGYDGKMLPSFLSFHFARTEHIPGVFNKRRVSLKAEVPTKRIVGQEVIFLSCQKPVWR